MTNDQMRIADARRSFTGKTLTDSQFDESWALAGIMERGVRKSGTFKEKLGDYAHAFARAERFDAMKAETIIRDIFKSRYGQTMNQMREGLMEREAAVRDQAKPEALTHARQIGTMIREGETMPFYRAFDHTAGQLAQTFNITEAGAKSLMKDVYQDVEGRDLYADSKEIEKLHHKPTIEKTKQFERSGAAQGRQFTRNME